VTVYNIDENLTPLLLTATSFMSHFADLGIGLDLEGAWPWPWSCYSLSWLQHWLLPVCKLVCACVCRAISLTMIITHWPRATLTCRSTIGLRTSPSHVDHTKLISYTYMHDIWRLRNADSMTPSMPSVISKIFSACLFVFVSNRLLLLMIGAHCTHTHTHLFNCPLFRTTWVNGYQKEKTNLDFTEARDNEWQWHQLGHMQVCTSVPTDNHASTLPLSFLQAGCPSCHQTNSVKALKALGHTA